MQPGDQPTPHPPSSAIADWCGSIGLDGMVLSWQTHITNNRTRTADDIYLNSRTFLWPGELEIVLNLSAKRLAVIRENLEIALKYVFTQPFLSPPPNPLPQIPTLCIMSYTLRLSNRGRVKQIVCFPLWTIYMLNFIQLFSVHLFYASLLPSDEMCICIMVYVYVRMH